MRKNPTRVVSFTSGKGGVGKTHTVINLALALQRLGRKVLVLDADFGLANVDVMLGLQPRGTIFDVLNGTLQLEEIIIDGPDGMSIIPSSSGVQAMCNLSAEKRLTLMRAIEDLSYEFDYLLIDTPAGIGEEVTYWTSSANEIVCVITSEPTSLTDAYALVKVLALRHGESEINIVANNVPDIDEARLAFHKLERAVARFLHSPGKGTKKGGSVRLNYLGLIPTDVSTSQAVKQQRALLEQFPASPAGRAISALARRIDHDFQEFRVKGGMQFFFQRILEAVQVNG